jgi:hypothetical protein
LPSLRWEREKERNEWQEWTAIENLELVLFQSIASIQLPLLGLEKVGEFGGREAKKRGPDMQGFW